MSYFQASAGSSVSRPCVHACTPVLIRRHLEGAYMYMLTHANWGEATAIATYAYFHQHFTHAVNTCSSLSLPVSNYWQHLKMQQGA